jgi:hypothetical protein
MKCGVFTFLGLKIFGGGCQVWIRVFIEGVLGGRDLRKKGFEFRWDAWGR